MVGLIIGIFESNLLSVEIGFLSRIKYTLLPISGNVWWFISVYLILMLMSPGLNQLLSSMTRKQEVYLIVAVWLMEGCLGKIDGTYYYSLFRGIWFFVIGHFIRKYLVKLESRFCIALYSVMWGGIAWHHFSFCNGQIDKGFSRLLRIY